MGSILTWIVVILALAEVAIAWLPNGPMRRVPSKTLSSSPSTRLLANDQQASNPEVDFSDDPELQSYMNGSKDVPWKGSRRSLARRKQVPLPEYTPQQVVRKCLDALQLNDEPQLDHGCCVLLEFKSPQGLLAESGLDPAGYGRFLRNSDYSILLDHNESELVGKPSPSAAPAEGQQEGKAVERVVQRVRVRGWSVYGKRAETDFDFHLSKIDDCWLLDVIVLVKQ